MARENRYIVGKIAYTSRTRRINQVVITWSLDGDRFSMCGEIWNGPQTDCVSVGQNLEEIAQLFPGNRKVQRMVDIWRRWHLNDMKAGSPAQEQYLRENPIDPAAYAYPKSHYDVACAVLAAAGLNPDPADGYRYGSAWRTETIPADVAAEIRSW